ncbi:YggT family protein [Nocardia altamirensis]|uniref:YggT family protein n=1 Tax=Nocardia altamirensis TaxID=472158 RepID=UPI00084064FC|nr:YggT family protein [Nocardia altamirensis]
MGLIGALLGFVLTLFILVMLARLIFDWIDALSTGPRQPWVSRARDLTHAGTEPVIAPVRRVLKPVRTGGFSLDLAFTAVFIVALILRAVAYSL